MNTVTFIPPTTACLVPTSAREDAGVPSPTSSRSIANSALSSDGNPAGAVPRPGKTQTDVTSDGSAVLAIHDAAIVTTRLRADEVASTNTKTAEPVASGPGQRSVAMDNAPRQNMPESEPPRNGSLLTRLRERYDIEQLVAQIYLGELPYATVQIGGAMGLDGSQLVCALRCGEPFPTGPAIGWWTHRSTYQVAHPGCVRTAEMYGVPSGVLA